MHEKRAVAASEEGEAVAGCTSARPDGRSEAGGARQSHEEELWGTTKTALGGEPTRAGSAR